jgi:hypothetical protein
MKKIIKECQSLPNMPVFISFFDNTTEAELRTRIELNVTMTLGHRNRIKKIEKGDLILLVNKDTKEAFGVTRAMGKCVEPHPFDAAMVYSQSKYNKWEVLVQPIIFFKKRLSQDTVCKLIGGKSSYRTNIYRNFQNGFQEAFVKTDDPDEKRFILDTLETWLDTYV